MNTMAAISPTEPMVTYYLLYRLNIPQRLEFVLIINVKPFFLQNNNGEEQTVVFQNG